MPWQHATEAQDNPQIKVTNMPRKEQPVVDTNVEIQQNPHSEDSNQFEDLECNNPDRLHVITRELDDLCHHIHAEEREPMESLHCIEWELQQLSISHNASAPPEPLVEVLKHYTDNLCSA